MPYIMIEGYECERCGYRWSSRNGTGFRDSKEPRPLPQVQEPLLEQTSEEQPSPGKTGYENGNNPVNARVKAE